MKKILVITFTGIGNMLMFMPSLKGLREMYPESHITLIYGNHQAKNVVDNTGIFDEYMYMERKVSSFLKVIRRVQKGGYSMSINGLFSSKNVLAIIPYLGRIPIRVGFANASNYHSKYGKFYTIPVKMESSQHEVDRRMELIKEINRRTIKEREFSNKMFLKLSENNKEFADEFYRLHNLEGKKVVCASVGSDDVHEWKRWNRRKYSLVFDTLMKKGYKVIINGAPSELNLISSITSRMIHKPIVSAGKTGSIRDVAGIIKKADLSITNDGGLMHVSVAVDTPVVAIFGPTDPCRARPRNKHDVVVRKDLSCSPCYNLRKKKKCKNNYRCFSDISVDDVLEKAMRILEETK